MTAEGFGRLQLGRGAGTTAVPTATGVACNKGWWVEVLCGTVVRAIHGTSDAGLQRCTSAGDTTKREAA